MLIYEDMTAVVASRAYELAQTGEFEDFAAIERELFAEGFGGDIGGLKKPELQNVLDAMCAASRGTDIGREHHSGRA
jgi:hypothetical protein